MSTTADDIYSDLQARAAGAPPPSNVYDDLEARAAGQPVTVDTGPAQPAAASSSAPTWLQDMRNSWNSGPQWERDWMSNGNPVDQFVQGTFGQAIGSTTGAIEGGLKGLWDIAFGGKGSAPADVENIERSAAYQPQTATERLGAEASTSNWNPLNWPGVALSGVGHFLGGEAAQHGAPPAVSTALDVGPTAIAMLGSPLARGARAIADLKPYEVEAERTAPAAGSSQAPGPPGSGQSVSAAAVGGGAPPQGAPEPDSAPIEGGLPTKYQDARAAILQRVGLANARESAIEGDAKDAASDFQMTKFDEPAGRTAAAQFEAERQALTAHAENIIGETGGTLGMDEDALAQRGQTIARPFDQLRQYFDANTRRLYTQADQQGAGTPLTNLDGVDTLLQDPSFRNTLLARDQGGLLSAVSNQLDRFREGNPQGFNAAGAEQVRQWLNQVWTPDNKWAVGQLKDAVDNDVLKTAGEDVYQAARAQRQLKAQTLDNPKGIATLFDTDPNTPINRTTPFEKIPDKLSQLPLDQFTNVLQTLKSMPDELQPDAQAALGEIRGHLVNKLLQAGGQTASGGGRALWSADRVANVLRTNAAKFRTAFSDDPNAQSAIQDLNSAGQIMKVDPSYPGAAAQAANAMKRGLLSRALRHVGGAVGAGAGGLMGPMGAAAGGVLGEMGGEALGASRAEAAALKGWSKRVRALPAADGAK